MDMHKRLLGDTEVTTVSLGCMNLSHAYGTPPSPEYSEKLIQTAYDLGINHFDTAILYGFGKNESLVGQAIKPFRQNIYLASKCGLTSPELKREINGRPEVIKQSCEQSLQRLQTDVIDLYYLHRLDKSVPIEESVGALKDLITEGKIRSIGLSEVSADTIRRAHKECPVTAVQSEYSLWSRNPEIAVLDACKDLGATFVSFSPLARGYLTGKLENPPEFVEKDLRNNMPRFQEPNYAYNLSLLEPLYAVAKDIGITPTQLALAWVLNKDKSSIVIPGTTKIEHLKENVSASNLVLSDEHMQAIEAAFKQEDVYGPRYNEKTQLEIDTEEYA